MNKILKHTFILTLSTIYFSTHVLFASAAETNFWSERKKSMQKASYEVASLPTSMDPLASMPITAPLTQTALKEHVSPAFSSKLTSQKHTPSLTKLLLNIPQSNFTIGQIYDSGKSESPLLLIQDVHMNVEAQTNISEALQKLIATKSLSMLGVEGAFSQFNFKPYREFPKREIMDAVAKEFFESNRLAAPSYAGLMSPTEPPPFIGIDDKTSYDANVQAYLSSRAQVEEVQKDLTAQSLKLQGAKQKSFSVALKEFDVLRTSYHKETLGLGIYVEKLHGLWSKNADRSDFGVEQFISAVTMERSLDFKKVEDQRKVVLEKLTRFLTPQETNDLLQKSIQFRAGEITYGRFYEDLKALCARKKIDLRQTPAFDNYVRYVLLSDGIDAEALFRKISRMEEDVTEDLAKTSQEKQLIAESERLQLTQKLIRFELTSDEWKKYVTLRGPKNGPRTPMSTFEDFYVQADIRTGKMIENLVSLANDGRGGLSTRPNAGDAFSSIENKDNARLRATYYVAPTNNIAFLVGGFHSKDLTAALRKRKQSFVVVSPKITKLSDEPASAYLSIFAQEKISLDQKFKGERLFLAPDSLNFESPKNAVLSTAQRRMKPQLIPENHLKEKLDRAMDKWNKMIIAWWNGPRRNRDLSMVAAVVILLGINYFYPTQHRDLVNLVLFQAMGSLLHVQPATSFLNYAPPTNRDVVKGNIETLLKVKRGLAFTDDTDYIDAMLFEKAKQLAGPNANPKDIRYLRLTLRDEEDLDRALTTVVVNPDGTYTVKDGPLIDLLRNGGVVFIDYNNSDAKIVESFNSVFDKNPYYDKVPTISPNLQIVGAMSEKNFKDYPASFFSRYKRMTVVPKEPWKKPLDFLEKAPENIDAFTVDLYQSPYFQAELVEKIYLDEKGKIRNKPGKLAEAVEAWKNAKPGEPKKQLVIRDGQFENSPLSYFLGQIILQGFFEYNGELIEIPKDFKIYYEEGSLSEKTPVAKRILAVGEAGQNAEVWTINKANLDTLFNQVIIKSPHMSQEPGLLERSRLTLRITEQLDPWVWHKILLSQDNQIDIEVVPGINPPSLYSDLLSPAFRKQSSKKPLNNFDSIKDLNSAFVESSDPEFAIKNILDAYPNRNIVMFQATNNSSLDQLMSQVQIRTSQNNDREFSTKPRSILEALQSSDENVIIINGLHANPELARQLETAVQDNSYLYQFGKRVNLAETKSKIFLVSRPKTGLIEADHHISVNPTFSDLKRTLKQEFGTAITDEHFDQLDKLRKAFESIPAPTLSGQHPTIARFNLSRLRLLCRIFQETGSWVYAVENVFANEYAESSEAVSLIRLAARLAFNEEEKTNQVSDANYDYKLRSSRDRNQVNLPLLRAALRKMGPDTTWYEHYFELIESCGLDILQSAEVTIENLAEKPTEKIFPLLQQALIKHYATQADTLSRERARYYERRYQIKQDRAAIVPAMETDVQPYYAETWEARMARIKQLMNLGIPVMLRGSPGTGKSYITNHLAASLGFSNDMESITIGADAEESQIVGRVDFDGRETVEVQEAVGRWKSSNHKMLVVDEANLANSALWNALRGSVSLKKPVVFTGNQNYLPGRKANEFIDDEMITIHFPDFDDAFLRKEINKDLAQKQDRQRLIETILDLHNTFKDITTPGTLSLRDVQELVDRVNTFIDTPNWAVEQVVEIAWVQYRGMFSPDERKALKFIISRRFGDENGTSVDAIEARQVAKLQERRAHYENTEEVSQRIAFVEPTARQIGKLETYLALREHRLRRPPTTDKKGKRGVLLEGPSARGKDLVNEAVLRANGFRNGELAERTTVPTTKLYYKLTTSLSYDKIFAIIERAQQEGALVMLSEMNLLSSGLLEGKLNALLTTKAAEGFGIIGSMNSTNFSGREKLSSALQNRLIYEREEDYSRKDLIGIATFEAQYLAEEFGTNITVPMIEYLVDIHMWIRSQVQNPMHLPTTRDLLNAMKLSYEKKKAETDELKVISDAAREIYGPLYLTMVLHNANIEFPKPGQFSGAKASATPEFLTKIGQALLPKRKKPFEAKAETIGAGGLWSESENTIRINEESIRNDASEVWQDTFWHEAGHAMATRHMQGAEIGGDLQDVYQDLEDVRHKRASDSILPFGRMNAARDGKNKKAVVILINAIRPSLSMSRLLTFWNKDFGKNPSERDLFQLAAVGLASGVISPKEVVALGQAAEIGGYFPTDRNPFLLAAKHATMIQEIGAAYSSDFRDEDENYFQQERALFRIELLREDFEKLSEHKLAFKADSRPEAEMAANETEATNILNEASADIAKSETAAHPELTIEKVDQQLASQKFWSRFNPAFYYRRYIAQGLVPYLRQNWIKISFLVALGAAVAVIGFSTGKLKPKPSSSKPTPEQTNPSNVNERSAEKTQASNVTAPQNLTNQTVKPVENSATSSVVAEDQDQTPTPAPKIESKDDSATSSANVTKEKSSNPFFKSMWRSLTWKNLKDTFSDKDTYKSLGAFLGLMALIVGLPLLVFRFLPQLGDYLEVGLVKIADFLTFGYASKILNKFESKFDGGTIEGIHKGTGRFSQIFGGRLKKQKASEEGQEKTEVIGETKVTIVPMVLPERNLDMRELTQRIHAKLDKVTASFYRTHSNPGRNWGPEGSQPSAQRMITNPTKAWRRASAQGERAPMKIMIVRYEDDPTDNLIKVEFLHYLRDQGFEIEFAWVHMPTGRNASILDDAAKDLASRYARQGYTVITENNLFQNHYDISKDVFSLYGYAALLPEVKAVDLEEVQAEDVPPTPQSTSSLAADYNSELKDLTEYLESQNVKYQIEELKHNRILIVTIENGTLQNFGTRPPFFFIRKLTLKNVSIDALPTMPQLESLDIDTSAKRPVNLVLSDERYQSLTTARLTGCKVEIQNSPKKLKSLSLDNSAIYTNNVSVQFPLLEHLSIDVKAELLDMSSWKFPRLTKLHLINIKDVRIPSRLPKLQEFGIKNSVLNETTEAAIHHAKRLSELELLNCSFGPSVQLDLLRNQNLYKLKVTGKTKRYLTRLERYRLLRTHPASYFRVSTTEKNSGIQKDELPRWFKYWFRFQSVDRLAKPYLHRKYIPLEIQVIAARTAASDPRDVTYDFDDNQNPQIHFRVRSTRPNSPITLGESLTLLSHVKWLRTLDLQDVQLPMPFSEFVSLLSPNLYAMRLKNVRDSSGNLIEDFSALRDRNYLQHLEIFGNSIRTVPISQMQLTRFITDGKPSDLNWTKIYKTPGLRGPDIVTMETDKTLIFRHESMQGDIYNSKGPQNIAQLANEARAKLFRPSSPKLDTQLAIANAVILREKESPKSNVYYHPALNLMRINLSGVDRQTFKVRTNPITQIGIPLALTVPGIGGLDNLLKMPNLTHLTIDETQYEEGIYDLFVYHPFPLALRIAARIGHPSNPLTAQEREFGWLDIPFRYRAESPNLIREQQPLHVPAEQIPQVADERTFTYRVLQSMSDVFGTLRWVEDQFTKDGLREQFKQVETTLDTHILHGTVGKLEDTAHLYNLGSLADTWARHFFTEQNLRAKPFFRWLMKHGLSPKAMYEFYTVVMVNWESIFLAPQLAILLLVHSAWAPSIAMSLGVNATSLLGLGIVTAALVHVAMSSVFGFLHKRYTMKQKLYLAGLHLFWGIFIFIPDIAHYWQVLRPMPFPMEWAGLASSWLIHSVHNALAPYLGAPLASMKPRKRHVKVGHKTIAKKPAAENPIDPWNAEFINLLSLNDITEATGNAELQRDEILRLIAQSPLTLNLGNPREPTLNVPDAARLADQFEQAFRGWEASEYFYSHLVPLVHRNFSAILRQLLTGEKNSLFAGRLFNMKKGEVDVPDTDIQYHALGSLRPTDAMEEFKKTVSHHINAPALGQNSKRALLVKTNAIRNLLVTNFKSEGIKVPVYSLEETSDLPSLLNVSVQENFLTDIEKNTLMCRFILPHGMELPSGFIPADFDRNRLRFYIMLMNTLNPITIEWDANNVDGLVEKVRLALKQA